MAQISAKFVVCNVYSDDFLEILKLHLPLREGRQLIMVPDLCVYGCMCVFVDKYEYV